MENVLKQLYDSEIYPAEQIVSSDPEYRPLSRKIGEERERLKGKLGMEDGERLEDLHSSYCDVSTTIL